MKEFSPKPSVFMHQYSELLEPEERFAETEKKSGNRGSHMPVKYFFVRTGACFLQMHIGHE